ncbi:SAM-dependent methyltransferase [Pinisolibacter sp.]|uniref:SAM-dependent methyltransferase n=1 Tax=Pinisolibacter sp. TaxID=2172024 RepID=UPI002FDDFD6F
MSSAEFERWNSRFAATESYVFGTAPNAFLASCREVLPKAGRALAIADGEGRNGVFLAECGLEVVSVDFSPAAQAKARALATARGVTIETVTADLLVWDWPEASFDVIAAIFFQFATPPERAEIFAHIRRALKPGGLLILEGYRPEQIAYGTGGPKTPENMYTRALLEDAFGDFDGVVITERDEVMDEGVGHSGMSAVIDLTGRRPK